MTPEGPQLKTKAGKLVHQMKLTTVDAFEKEKAEFDRNEQVLMQVRTRLLAGQHVAQKSQTEILEHAKRNLALVQQIYALT